jgi:putative inorganic carbon (hco3(-)) transporter
MNSVWQQFTLMNPSLQRWSQSSYLTGWIGLAQKWRQNSWVMQWADQIGLLLLLLMFGLAPFVSTALVGLLLFACACYWGLLTLSDESRSGLTPIHLVVLLYWGIATVATALSPAKTAALVGWGKLTLYMLGFALMVRVLRSPRYRNLLITVYLLVALAVSVKGIQQSLYGAEALATWVDTQSSLANTTRVYSYLGNPNLLAAYLVPAIALSVAAIFTWRRWTAKVLAAVMVVVNSYCLIVTYSRGGWIGFVVLGFVLLILLVHWFSIYLPQFWRVWTMPLVLGISAVAVLMAVLFVEPVRDRVASIFVGREDSSNNYRINVWSGVLKMIHDRPLIGIGPGNSVFNKVYPHYQLTGFSALSAYSVFLEVMVETGAIGFTCFLWLLLVTFNQGWTQLQRLRQTANREGFWLMAAIAAMLGMLSHGLVDTVWYRPQVSTLWWLMIALVASYYKPLSSDSLS